MSDKLREALTAALGEAVEITTYDAAHVIYTIGGRGELHASSYQLDGAGAVVSAPLWPRSHIPAVASGLRLVDTLRRSFPAAPGDDEDYVPMPPDPWDSPRSAVSQSAARPAPGDDDPNYAAIDWSSDPYLSSKRPGR